MKPHIHHFGQVVRDIDEHLTRSLWVKKCEIVTDPIQKSRLVLVSYPDDDESPFIELVEPLGPDSPTWGALEKGAGWHHVCLSVASREAGDDIMKAHRMLPVSPWSPAVLFGGKHVRFVYSRNRELIEFLALDVED